jgi:hypothetical protein
VVRRRVGPRRAPRRPQVPPRAQIAPTLSQKTSPNSASALPLPEWIKKLFMLK